MSRLFRPIFLATVLATSMLAAQPALAGKYCLQGRHWGYPGNCQFATYQQCQVTASGTQSYCGINPAYASRQRRGY